MILDDEFAKVKSDDTILHGGNEIGLERNVPDSDFLFSRNPCIAEVVDIYKESAKIERTRSKCMSVVILESF